MGKNECVDKSVIVAMAVGVIAEDLGTDVKRVKVISFEEIKEGEEIK